MAVAPTVGLRLAGFVRVGVMCAQISINIFAGIKGFSKGFPPGVQNVPLPSSGLVWLYKDCYYQGMPRKPTIQPAPKESFTLDDGTVVEIRDHATREIGPGQDKKFNAEELDWQVLHGLVDDLQSNDLSRINRANVALSSNHAIERYLSSGGYEMDERTGRRRGRSIRKKYEQMIYIVN